MTTNTLAVVSSTVHYSHAGELYAYAPYSREIEVWADLFTSVVIAAPIGDGLPPTDCVAIRRPNITLVDFPKTGGDTVRAKLAQLFLVPWLLVRLGRVLRTADAIHVRCPGNLGLLGALTAPLCSRQLVAKYAGQWTGYSGEALTTRFQRWILRSRWWTGPVTVYGNWPDQPSKVTPFFTSVLTRSEVERGLRSAQTARPHQPLRLLFVGRLSQEKRAEAVVEATAMLTQRGVPAVLRILGDGPERAGLEVSAATLGASVEFLGAVPPARVLEAYEWADALVLVSETEGWPKAITEAMTFGLVCVGSDRGLVTSILGEGRGLVVAPGSASGVADVLGQVAATETRFREMGRAASIWASRHSIEDLRAAIRELLERTWNTVLIDGAPDTDTKRRVLHLVDSLASGGAERVAVNLANGLASRGHRVTLATTRQEGTLADSVAEGVTRLSLERRGRLGLLGVAKLWRHVREHRIELIHAHGTSLFTAAVVGMLPPWPSVVWHDHFGKAGLNRAARPIYLYRLVGRRVSRVIAVSEELRTWAIHEMRISSTRVHLVPNAIGRNPLAAARVVSSGGIRLACVANLRPEKDQATLIKAMVGVVEQYPDVELLLAGAPVDEAYAHHLAELVLEGGLGQNVQFLGLCDDVPALLTRCDIGVLCSRVEASPLALLEYGAAGLPVVATSVGDAVTVLSNGSAGVLVPPQEPAALTRALLDLMRDASKRQQFADRLSDRVAERYSLEKMLSRIEDLYGLTLDRRARPRPIAARAPCRTSDE